MAAIESAALARLRDAETFRQVACSLEELGGVPITLWSIREWPPAQSGKCKNPFCAVMIKAGRECIACSTVGRAIEQRRVSAPQTVTCVGGLYESAVPVRKSEELIGFVGFGPVLNEAPTEQQFASTIRVLEEFAGRLDRPALRKTYFESAVVPEQKQASLIRLLIIFAEHLSSFASDPRFPADPAQPPPVSRALQFIAEHQTEKLSLGEVAHAAGLNTSYFCRMFKKATAVSFTQYLARVRIEQAQRMLADPNLRVNEVAFAVGFQSVAHFNRVFRQLTKQSPGEYRAGIKRPQ